MIETTIPGINVFDLMEQVRLRAEEIKDRQRTGEPPQNGENALPPSPPVSAPFLALPKPAPSRRERLQALIDRARRDLEVSSWIPKPIRGWFRKQGDYNRAVLEGMGTLARANGEFASRLEQLTACVEVQQSWLLADRQYLAGRHDIAANEISRLAESTREELRSGREHAAQNFAELRKELFQLGERFDQVGEELIKLRQGHDRAANELGELRTEINDRVVALEAHLQKQHEDLVEKCELLRRDGELAGEHLRNLQTTVTQSQAEIDRTRDRLDAVEVEQQGLAPAIERLREESLAENAFSRAQLSHHDLLLQRLVAATSPQASAKSDAAQTELARAFDNRFDAFYLRFEDRFRGSRGEIKERISFYLPFIWETDPATAGYPVVDIGSGRGEWLELLRDIGIEARGVDINSAMLDVCRKQGLEVTEADALDYLRLLPDNSLRALTGFHIIEHLPFDVLMDVFAEAYRVVRPGGVVIFESPNCKNLIVGACNFNVDPTHRNPVFPDTAKFILETRGFNPVELEYLTPIETSRADSLPPTLKELLYGPQDFAAIAHKPPQA